MSSESRQTGSSDSRFSPAPASHSPNNSIRSIKMESTQHKVAVPDIDTEYNALCQLSYAPATQTTVVTTTTTTTTSFPPFVVNAPRNLKDRDPKQYPLAATPTPSSMKRFCFDIDGKAACFHEADDTEVALQDYSEQHAALAASNGSITSTMEPDAYQDTSIQSSQHTPARYNHNMASQTTSHSASINNPRKRSVPASTPVSLFRAVEMANSERKNRRVGGRTFESHSPITPEASELNAGRLTKAKKPRIAAAESHHDHHRSLFHAASGAHLRDYNRQGSPLARSFDSSSTETDGPPSPPSFIDGLGMAATPPVAESDFDPMGSFTENIDSNAQALTPYPTIDTTSLQLQDPSLPSPLLSPVTAAASPVETDLNYLANESGLVKQMEAADSLISMTGRSPVPRLPTVSSEDFTSMFDSFDSLPSKVQTWFMYQLLRRCGKPTLHFVADVVNPALKCDFLARLPLELSMNVVRFLDVKTMCRAAQVSRKWREIVNTDENAWRNLLIKDGFTVPKHEMDRARREGWEWQGLENYEKDLSASLRRIGDMTSSSRTGVVSRDGDRHSVSTPVARGTKRKLSSKSGSNKRRKIKHFKKHKQLGTAISLSDGAMVPRVLNPLALTADIPELGLKSLRLPHLYKSVYRRHYGIRRGWMEEGMEPLHLAFRAHGRHVVTCLQFDTDKILTGSDDTRIHVYNTKSGALDNVLNGHEGGVWALQYDGNTLVSGSTDRTVRVWNIQTGECLHVFQGHTSTVRCLVILKPTVVGHRADGSPIMMPKEPLIITGSRDSTLRIWKLPRPGAESVFQTVSQVNEDSNPYFVRTLSGHIHSVRAIAAHGDTLVSGSYDATVRVWKISTGEVAHRLNGHAAKVYSVILDHERNRCISGSMDNLVKVWSLESGVCLFNLEGHTSLVGLLDLGHQRLVSAAADSTLRIWDPETGQCKSTLSAHTGAITCFQHDAQKVISGSDRTLKMWDVKTGECVRDLLTDLSGVWQVKFNERKCVAAVQRNNWTYIEVLDFGASRDGLSSKHRRTRWVVDEHGDPVDDFEDDDDLDDTL